MKSILLSIKPLWIVKILNKDKTIEVRKQFPKDYIGWVYIYCTKDRNNTLMRFGNGFVLQTGDYAKYFAKNWQPQDALINGKIVARFWCNKVEEIQTDYAPRDTFFKECCLTPTELFDYIGHSKRYAIHISKLEIFDKPKELGDFKHFGKPTCEKCPFAFSVECDYYRETECDNVPLTKAPQNYCYVEE